MPTCLHFLQGACSRNNCLYPHVKLSSKAPICRDFVRGFCPLGLEVSHWIGTFVEVGFSCFVGLRQDQDFGPWRDDLNSFFCLLCSFFFSFLFTNKGKPLLCSFGGSTLLSNFMEECWVLGWNQRNQLFLEPWANSLQGTFDDSAFKQFALNSYIFYFIRLISPNESWYWFFAPLWFKIHLKVQSDPKVYPFNPLGFLPPFKAAP